MNIKIIVLSVLLPIDVLASSSSHFIRQTSLPDTHYAINGPALCATARQTLAYLAKGSHYDPKIIHEGTILKIPLARIKETLKFICQHQEQLNNPTFIQKNFEFYRWYPDKAQVKENSIKKPLIARLPQDKILMTKYYVHRAKASSKPDAHYSYALHGLPDDEKWLTIDEANAKPGLIRFQYGKHAIYRGALSSKKVPVLAYVTREDLEAALLQGTLIAEFPDSTQKIFNVHRHNNIAYDKSKSPYQQDRYWYFRQVDGIKGYGKDADYKITINPEVTFAADLEQFGLGKLLAVQYPDGSGKIVTKAGIFADTGGAFYNNLYQVDFLAGTYTGKEDFQRAARHLPDYVNAYFMVLKK